MQSAFSTKMRTLQRPDSFVRVAKQPAVCAIAREHRAAFQHSNSRRQGFVLGLHQRSGFCSAPGQRRLGRSTVQPAARRDSYAEYDDDIDEAGSLIPGVFGTALGALNGLSDLLVDVLPIALPRPVAGVVVKGGLFLIVLGFAKSLLSFVVTIGTIVLGLYVASKVLGKE